MPPKRTSNLQAKTTAAGKAKAAPKPKGKPAAKSVAVPKAAPRAAKAEKDKKEKKMLLAKNKAQLELAVQKAEELEAVVQEERFKAGEAEKRTAAAEAYLNELKERASRTEALQLEVAQAQARAAHAEAKAEVLSELQESFQRNVPEMVRSIAETMLEYTSRRRSQRTLTGACFSGVKPKLEIEDNSDPMPLMPLGVSEDLMKPDRASDQLMKFYGQNGPEEIPSSAETKSDSQSGRSIPKVASRLTDGVAGVFNRAVRSTSGR
ncbi:unnamed protein product [Durusdinium trenchii]|uniref:Uncharacterized protein n=1 Tax=Durusdinium trenchii TaxID=1381693 RepID=A0ABP0J7H6_9DINO